jgi:hypothetical protein
MSDANRPAGGGPSDANRPGGGGASDANRPGGAGPSNANRPTFVVCEDGDEYTQRFERFLGREFRFERAADGAEAEQAARANRIAGILLDLDFSRIAPERLLDESGPPARPPAGIERTRLAASQGILILQHLRRQCITASTLLFADLDDASHVAFLESTLSPLAVISSREGLAQIAARLRILCARG